MKREKLFSLTKKDFRVETFKASGKGGQNRNKRETAVRITHVSSGISGYSADERHQEKNKFKAFQRLIANPKFKAWIKLEASKAMMKETLDEKVDNMMNVNNLKIEIKNEKGQWIENDIK